MANPTLLIDFPAESRVLVAPDEPDFLAINRPPFWKQVTAAESLRHAMLTAFAMPARMLRAPSFYQRYTEAYVKEHL